MLVHEPDIAKRHEDLILYKTYNPEEYPTYDNYDAIEVAKIEDIPMDYDGVMGVPITFLDKYNPDQFEIVGTSGRQRAEMSDMKPYAEHKECRRKAAQAQSCRPRTTVDGIVPASSSSASSSRKQAAMKIELKEITVRDLVEGYEDNDEPACRLLAASSTSGRPTSASSSTRTSSATP